VSLSAADELVGRPVSDLRALALTELARLLPELRAAEVRDFFVTREPEATFRAAPGSARWRPSTSTQLAGLHLAGAWTATGWPATMEGAVRSGEAAAAAVLGRSPAASSAASPTAPRGPRPGPDPDRDLEVTR
jgi:uncharacterized protein with NAD-binding domain and iron-sulfur cluster